MRFGPRGQLARSLCDSWLWKPFRLFAVIQYRSLKAISAVCQVTMSSVCCVPLAQLRTFSCMSVLHLLVCIPPQISEEMSESWAFCAVIWTLPWFCQAFLLQGGQHWGSKACNPALIAIVICCLISIERILPLTSPPALFPDSFPIHPVVLVGEKKVGRCWVDR